MRKIYFIIPYILILSCGKAPEPMTAVAENAPLEIPEEINNQALKLKKLYEPTSIIFNFFFWPSNLDDETLKELSAEVSRIGIGVEKKFKQMDKNNENIFYFQKNINNLKIKKEGEIAELYKKYCEGETCVRDDLPTQPPKIPQTCKEKGTPCYKEKSEIEKNFKDNSDSIKDEIKNKEKENEDLLHIMAVREVILRKLLENGKEDILTSMANQSSAQSEENLSKLLENENENVDSLKKMVQTEVKDKLLNNYNENLVLLKSMTESVLLRRLLENDKGKVDFLESMAESLDQSEVILRQLLEKSKENIEILESLAQSEVNDILENDKENVVLLKSMMGAEEEHKNEWVNWMQTETGDAQIKFITNEQFPEITFEILFNNKDEKCKEIRKLKYTSIKSEENKFQPDIIIDNYNIENQIPVLEFTLYEKCGTGPDTEVSLGRYYKMKLRQTELDYGLEFLGDVERFDKGKSLGKGLMKIYFPRDYDEDKTKKKKKI